MTKTASTVFLLALVFALPRLVSAQGTPQAAKDPQAVMILARSLQAAGGAQAIGTIQDFTETGSITYNWAGKEVQAGVTARGRGTDEFRLDARLSDGTQSWAIAGGKGSLKRANGKTSQIPLYDAINLGGLTFPFLGILTALNDLSVSVSFVDQEDLNGASAYRIRAQKNLGAAFDPQGTESQWTLRDYLIDSATYLPVEVQDITHPVETHLQSYLHEVIFSDYRSTSGVVVPFSITEKISGQTIWTIQFSSISLNSGLTDSDFQL